MPRKRRKKSKIYFGTPAQEAIIEYNNSEDFEERSKIYEERIKYPFEKLAENVMNTFKFSYFDVPKIDVQMEVVSTMVEKMHMFQEGKGRAFSYFTIIAKNHLILKNNGNYKRWKQNSLLSQMPQTWNPQNDHYEVEEKNEFKVTVAPIDNQSINDLLGSVIVGCKVKSVKETSASIHDIFIRTIGEDNLTDTNN